MERASRLCGEHLSQCRGERLRLARPAILVAEESAVATREHDGCGAESFGNGNRRALPYSSTIPATGSTSLPFFDRSGSVHAARLKQQGRRFPPAIFDILTSTRRVRVSGFLVALIQRIHSQRAIGVMSRQRSRIF